MNLFKFPKIEKHKELPQWILSSEKACYHPSSNTIHIKNDQGIASLLHEYSHWFAHVVGGSTCFLHKILDHGTINLR